ncbi:MAG: threonine--tRNA ligase [Candidatus Margulisiibacteriota bacterium]|nr:MAG: threonine--tRNA ligase [Candidatus Margulisbacteria bacterium GWF2_38_17]OGI08321.1 MAG: threonine--tRNA ligase [Candidatus Margulisbacteria bacterium GWE2_39_32]PZM82317.1 MAG: threonine--tRNA ligase [Candidatus Margulisiibacteriota bacterium]HCY37026.1 threonine--tRNA ligase [Candidatus Margulisiibacteriota bacterium]
MSQNNQLKIDLQVYRHSTAHIMAAAVLNLFPDVKLGIGPATEDGFYYDFDIQHPLSPEDLQLIEAEMLKIIKRKVPFQHENVSKEVARALLEKAKQDYKLELLNDISENEVTIYRNAEFFDLCRGPHIESTGDIVAFKIIKVAGAYWRGNESNKMLQRIYGTAFFTKKELDDYLYMLEEAKKRDHRKLGKELDLFSFQEEGPGFVFWHPKGMSLYNKILDYWKQVHKKYDYEEIRTPIILHENLWHQSGHWDNYRENMYFVTIDDQSYAIKPMNCPGGILVYKNANHSYKELPIKLAELGLVHRHERSGVLHGLFRVRQFTQDDAHIYCEPSQIEDEIINIISLVEEIYTTFDFKNYDVELSTRPAKSIGSDEVWSKAEVALQNALSRKNIKFKINAGDGAFYGPKIDFHVKDCLGRSWQCGTIQLDFSMPERFDLTFVGQDGNKHRPVMIHRAILGSIERFIGILIEHYAGAFPLWLAPVQVLIIPIGERHNEYAAELVALLKENNVAVKLDSRNEKMGYKIREAEVKKIPYMLVVGDKEMETRSVSIRSKKKGNIEIMNINEMLNKFSLAINNKLDE